MESMESMGGVTREQAEQYTSGLRNGWQGSAELYCLFGKFCGAGVKYSACGNPSNLTVSAKDGLNEKNYVQYIAPAFIMRQTIGEKFALTWGISVGYVHYRSEIRFRLYDVARRYPFMLFKAHTAGSCYDASFEYFPVKRLSFGVNIGYFAAIVSEGKVISPDGTETLDLKALDDEESLARFNYSIGVSYYF